MGTVIGANSEKNTETEEPKKPQTTRRSSSGSIALRGNTMAAKEIADRSEGRARQAVELSKRNHARHQPARRISGQ